MEDILIECSPGISGDMLLGAFYDLGVPKRVIEQPLVALGLNDLYNLVTKNKKPRSTFEDGEKSLCIANAAFKSLKLKKVVTI